MRKSTFNERLAAYDMSAAQIVARAGRDSGKDRWTVLTIYLLPSEEAAIAAGAHGGRWISEIVGHSRLAGEETRVRRASWSTLAKALSWKHFDERSPLYRELRAEIHDMLERTPAPAGKIGNLVVVKTSHEPDRVINRPILGVADNGTLVVGTDPEPFNGDTFREALTWLYGDDVKAAVTFFVQDWGTEIDGERDVFEVLEREDEDGLPGWAETFVRCMRHFKREEFHAARAR